MAICQDHKLFFDEPAEAATPLEPPTDIDRFRNELSYLMDSPECRDPLLRLRASIPEDVPLSAIMRALLIDWDSCSGQDKVSMLNEAMGFNEEKLKGRVCKNDD